MALPTKAKTWQYNVNQAVALQGSIIATSQRLWRTIKNSLVGFATLPWTVRGSSDSVAAGMDAVDRWAADANLVNDTAGNVHSWIVLRQTGIATNFEICLDLNSNGGSGNFDFIVSPGAGFTGGSTTARPTATDEVVTQANSAYAWSNVDANHVVHVLQSTDGQCTRVAVWRASTNLCTFWILDKPANPVTGWTKPSLFGTVGVSSGVVNTAGLFGNFANTTLKGYGSAAMVLAMTGEGSQATSGLLSNLTGIGTTANSFDGTWPLFPIGIGSITVAMQGRHGTVFDLWWRPTSLGQIDTFPNDTSRQFVVMGDFVLPWDGSVPVIT